MSITIPLEAIELTPGSAISIHNLSWQDFGSTTFKRPQIAGVEPDTCLYIQNAERVRGCTDMDLPVYSPPDLAIEADATSQTTLEVYEAVRVPEVWIYRNHQLTIHVLREEGYAEAVVSPIFPNLPLGTLIPERVQQAISEGTSQMLRELRMQLRTY